MRTRRPGSVLLSVILLSALVPVSSGAVEVPRANPGDETGRLVLLLDSSGSMKEPAAGGGTKIDAAKAALGDVVEQLPESAQVGIRVFGAKVFTKTDPGACADTQNVVPGGPLDRAPDLGRRALQAVGRDADRECPQGRGEGPGCRPGP